MNVMEQVMPDYGEILRFLAHNPPQLPVDRQLHASLLELLASCLRDPGEVSDNIADHTSRTFDSRHHQTPSFN